ncbi:MAG: CBS domain-containing protein [Chloroflexota bacterium]|jgi:signal-transduction protein with cAMP-binding, CBS, and nucleotidyltransferase domain
MKVADMMIKEVVQAAPEESIGEAAKRMRDQAVGCLIVTVGSAVKGIITDRDLLTCLAEGHDPYCCAISRHMNRPVVVIGPEEDHVTAASVLCRKRIKRLPVAKDGKLLGIISLSDLAKVAGEEAQKLGLPLAFLSAVVQAQSSHTPALLFRLASVAAAPSMSTADRNNSELLDVGGPG